MIPPPHTPARRVLEATSTAATLMPGYGEADHSKLRPLLGASRFGGAFGYNPFSLYAANAVSSPNALVLGKIGNGKSALVKAYLARMLAYGYPALVIDPKGEYRALAERFGEGVVTLMRGGEGVNPFVPPSIGDSASALEFNCEMAERAIEALTGHPVSALEGASVRSVLGALGDEVGFLALRRGLAELDERGGPVEWLGEYQKGSLAEAVVALDRLLQSGLVSAGERAGSLASRLGKGIVAVDLSAAFGSSLYSLAATMVLASVRALQLRPGSPRVVVAVDEIWALAEEPEAARWLRSYWKLSRALGIANLGVTHRLSDLRQGAGAGSAGLLQDSETIVTFAMEQGDAEAICHERGLAPELARTIARLPKGSALWQFGKSVCVVDHILTRTERRICDTDARLRGDGPEPGFIALGENPL
ncbi:MAG: DUF87 domain-containing protein [Nitrospiraceae bacterium]|nr:DUF87 domain-containing protein [Nitrospiraceae bacterium]